MNYSGLALFVEIIDKTLLLFCLLLAAAILLVVFFKERLLAKRILQLIRVKSELLSLAKQGEAALKKTCPVIMEKTSPQDFLDLARSKSSFMPPEFADELKKCFIVSGKAAGLEKIATSPRGPKWQRIRAIVSLGYAEDADADGLLKEALLDKDADVSYYAMLSLAQLKTKEAARILLEHLPRKQANARKIASCLENFPPSVVDELIQASYSNNGSVRFWALRIMGRYKDARSLQRAIELAQDGNPEVRASSCECLGALGDARAKTILLERLNDTAWFVRLHAVRALHKIAGAEALEPIEPLRADKHWFIRNAVERIMTVHKKQEGSR